MNYAEFSNQTNRTNSSMMAVEAVRPSLMERVADLSATIHRIHDRSVRIKAVLFGGEIVENRVFVDREATQNFVLDRIVDEIIANTRNIESVLEEISMQLEG